jgi:hypothetical protein
VARPTTPPLGGNFGTMSYEIFLYNGKIVLISVLALKKAMTIVTFAFKKVTTKYDHQQQVTSIISAYHTLMKLNNLEK